MQSGSNLSRRSYFLAVCAVAAYLLSGCGPQKFRPKVYQLGDKAEVPPFSIQIVDTNWFNQLPGNGSPRVPNRRFFVLHVSATNTGKEEASMPTLSLLAGDTERYEELHDGAGIENWLGLVRRVKPGQSLDGRIVFDAPPQTYQLRIGDDYDEQNIALVDLPLEFKNLDQRVDPPVAGQ